MSIIDPQIYEDQRAIQDRCEGRYAAKGSADDHSMRCLQLANEVHEVLNLMGWKPHRKPEDGEFTIDRDELLDELSDVYKFFLNLLHIHNVGINEFEEAYGKKHAIVLERLEAEGL